VLSFAVGLFPLSVYAQDLSASDLLKKIGETCREMSSYSVVAERKVDLDTNTTLQTLYAAPDASYGPSHGTDVIKVSLMASSSSKAKLLLNEGKKDIVVVSDGKLIWTLLTAQHESWARLEPSKTLKVGKDKKERYVLTIREPGSSQTQKLWVDKREFTVWKSVDKTISLWFDPGVTLQTMVTMTAEQMTRNPPLDDSNFAFTPPRQAKKVNSLKLSGSNPF
jgi:outer membrane lipoprotein-sorting protein